MCLLYAGVYSYVINAPIWDKSEPSETRLEPANLPASNLFKDALLLALCRISCPKYFRVWGLDSSSLSLVPLRIEIMLSYLSYNDLSDVSCYNFNLGKRSSRLMPPYSLDQVFILSTSFSFRSLAARTIMSTFYLFSSIPFKNSFWSSRNKIVILSNSLANPSEDVFRSTMSFLY